MNEDKIDPICGMEGTIQAYGHYFCSKHCINKYEQEHNITIDKENCPSCSTAAKKWYKERLYLLSIIIVISVTVSYFVPILKPFYEAFIDYLMLIWWAILLGFLIGGIIDYFIPQEYIKKYLSRHQKRTIIYSIIFGFLMSACSHGILAISMELYKKGASTSSVIAFLLASPWANLPITLLLFGFFGVKAFYIIITTLIIATITGLIYQKLEKNDMVECDRCRHGEDIPVLTNFSISKDILRRFNEYKFTWKNIIVALKGVIEGSWALTKMVLWWLLIGMIMAALARAYIPHDLFVSYMGPTLLGLGVTLLFATLIEVCSEGSSPLSFEIYNQTGAFGNSYIFLLSGVITDYTEIGLIWSNIGKKAAIWLPIITIPQALIAGYLFNIFL